MKKDTSLLIDGLADLCQQRLLEEKWLIAPSLRIGHQWLDSVTRRGQSVVNVRIKTLRSMALELAAAEIGARNLQLLSGQAGPLLVDRVFRRLQAEGPGFVSKPDSLTLSLSRKRESGPKEPLRGLSFSVSGQSLAYLGALRATTGLAEMVHRSVQAIRMAGLEEGQLVSKCFEVDAKAKDIVRILQEYLAELHQRGLIDYAEVLRIAIQQIPTDHSLIPEGALVILPEDLKLGVLERQLLEVLPYARKSYLPVDQPVDADTQPLAVPTDVALLRWLPRPADAPLPTEDGTVRFFRSVGEVNEVRQVLRQLTATGVPLDDAELLYADSETYVPLIYETFATLAADDASLEDDLPVTFAEGIPSRYFRPGRLLTAWVAWVNEDFPQARLVAMIREGLLTAPDLDESRFSFRRLAAVLRRIGIGFGRDRYVAKLDEAIASCHRRMESLHTVEDEDRDAIEEAKGRMARQLDELRVLRQLVAALLDVSPSPDAANRTILNLAFGLLEKLARSVNKSDNFARQRLAEEITELRNWLGDDDSVGLDIWDWLSQLPSRSRVLGSGPRPGRIHTTSITTGGHTGRPVTFIVGLDDSRFPGAGSQDPLLLDGERQRISADLPTAASNLEETIGDFYRLLARLRGHVVLSFPSHDVIDDRQKFPSPLVLAAYRMVSANREGTQDDFFQWLAAPASFAPAEDDQCLNRNDWWLRQLCYGEPVRDAERTVMSSFPHLARGSEAAARRDSEEFTVHDGYVAAAGVDLDPTAADGPVMSSARLELIGRCPLAFFFQRGLEIAPPEELGLDTARWIDPLAYGSLLHEVFETFFRDLIEKRQLPKYPDNLPQLEAILAARIQVYRQNYPPPNEHAFQTQVAELSRVARTFLSEEDQFCSKTGSKPIYLESNLGMKGEGEGSQLDTADPIPIRLSDGSEVRVRGRVDRIDQVSGGPIHSYAIWDYKTGSAWKYREGDPFRQGRVVQPALYLAMVTHRLKKAVSAKAQVVRFGFFFPGTRERGRRIQWSPDQLSEGTTVLNQLVSLVRSGAFLATDSADDCNYCDYRLICGDTKVVAAASKKKLTRRENRILQPFRELRGYGET